MILAWRVAYQVQTRNIRIDKEKDFMTIRLQQSRIENVLDKRMDFDSLGDQKEGDL